MGGYGGYYRRSQQANPPLSAVDRASRRTNHPPKLNQTAPLIGDDMVNQTSAPSVQIHRRRNEILARCVEYPCGGLYFGRLNYLCKLVYHTKRKDIAPNDSPGNHTKQISRGSNRILNRKSAFFATGQREAPNIDSKCLFRCVLIAIGVRPAFRSTRVIAAFFLSYYYIRRSHYRFYPPFQLLWQWGKSPRKHPTPKIPHGADDYP